MAAETPETHESVTETTALQRLLALSDAGELTPGMVQDAINELVPRDVESACDAEVILGYAAFGAEQNPHDSDWGSILERANKIYHRELSANQA